MIKPKRTLKKGTRKERSKVNKVLPNLYTARIS